MTAPPVLAVHVGSDIPPLMAQLLAADGPVWTPRAADPGALPDTAVAGHLYTVDVLPRRLSAGSAVWHRPGLWPTLPAGVVRVVELPLAVASDADVVVVDSRPSPVAARAVLPFTRSCHRRLRDLPAHVVLSVEAGPEHARWGTGAADRTARRVPDGTLSTLYAVASCAVAVGDAVLDALQWACPVVTDEATASSHGLVPDRHVLVAADPADVDRLINTLIEAPETAARLVRAGHDEVAARSPAAAAAVLARRLGFEVRATGPSSNGLLTAMDALGTPVGAHVRARVREHTAALPGAVTHTWRPDVEETE